MHESLYRPPTPASPVTNIKTLIPRLLTVKQAAAYTGATVWAIRQLYWAKDILGFIAGRRLLLDRASLDQWIDRRLSERAA
jgi:excisionase family DNA binding protein